MSGSHKKRSLFLRRALLFVYSSSPFFKMPARMAIKQTIKPAMPSFNSTLKNELQKLKSSMNRTAKSGLFFRWLVKMQHAKMGKHNPNQHFPPHSGELRNSITAAIAVTRCNTLRPKEHLPVTRAFITYLRLGPPLFFCLFFSYFI